MWYEAWTLLYNDHSVTIHSHLKLNYLALENSMDEQKKRMKIADREVIGLSYDNRFTILSSIARIKNDKDSDLVCDMPYACDHCWIVWITFYREKSNQWTMGHITYMIPERSI